MSDHRANVEVKIGSERNFGIVFAVVFALVGLWPLTGGENARPIWLLMALVFLALALFAPRVLRIPNRLWFRFGLLLGAIVAPVVMALVYVTTFVPIGLVLRLRGKDLLKMKFDREAASYWIERTDKPQSMKNQF